MMNNIEEALSDYNTAIQLNPLNGGAFVSFYILQLYSLDVKENRANALCIKGDLPAAMKDSEKAIELNNESSDAWKARYSIYK